MPGEQPFVTITNAEVWAELRHHERSDDDGGHADHEKRIRRLEFRYYALLMGLLSGLAGVTAIGRIS